jgi:hypothetical protein
VRTWVLASLAHTWQTNGTERMRIDSSGRLLIGHQTAKGYALDVDKANIGVASFNRTGTDGEVVSIRKDGTVVGSIGTQSGTDFYITGSTAIATGLRFQANEIVPVNGSAGNVDAAIDLGKSNIRFKDLYLSGGAYLGGAVAANKLDDYEEGTWTATPTFAAGTATGAATGRYTKVENRITYE